MFGLVTATNSETTPKRTVSRQERDAILSRHYRGGSLVGVDEWTRRNRRYLRRTERVSGRLRIPADALQQSKNCGLTSGVVKDRLPPRVLPLRIGASFQQNLDHLRVVRPNGG